MLSSSCSRVLLVSTFLLLLNTFLPSMPTAEAAFQGNDTVTDLDILYTVAAEIISSSAYPQNNYVIPGFSARCRTVATSILSNITFAKGSSRCNMIIGGGYNVGVRYTLYPNAIISPPNTSFAAYADARNYPSEAETMRNFAVIEGNIPFDSIMLEEDSTGTDENAKCSAVLLLRLARFTYYKPALRVALVTNLYHMPTALPDFLKWSYEGAVITPYFAEDWVSIIPGHRGLTWIADLTDYYQNNFPQYNVTALNEIMTARHNGDLSVSVGSLMQ